MTIKNPPTSSPLTIKESAAWLNSHGKLIERISANTLRYWIETRQIQPVRKIAHITLFAIKDIAVLGELIRTSQQLRKSNKRPFPTRARKTQAVETPSVSGGSETQLQGGVPATHGGQPAA